jgi:hypothetical protein
MVRSAWLALKSPPPRFCIMNRFRLGRLAIAGVFAAWLSLAAERLALGGEASIARMPTPLLLAQTGTAKTAIGWVIVLLCIGLGLLVVCRPSGRTVPGEEKKKRKK